MTDRRVTKDFLRFKMCARKRQFETKAEAEAVEWNNPIVPAGMKIHSYKCEYCHKWHNGKTKEKQCQPTST
jgi:hypothetical protein